MEVLPVDTPRIVGQETEYATTHDQKFFDLGHTSAFRELLGFESTSLFLLNGGRLYADLNKITEYATPECTSVDGLLASHFAGELLADQLVQLRWKQGTTLIKRTLDSTMNSRADHENYYIRGKSPDFLKRKGHRLAGHLATRVVLTGPGAYLKDPEIPGHYQYHLDQRAAVTAPISEKNPGLATLSSIKGGTKPFMLTRNEPFDDRGLSDRLQIVCGSQNMFAFPIAARFFNTSSVLRLLEHGTFPSALTVAKPYEAIKIAGGPNGLTEEIELANGKKMSAPQIQQLLAERALKFLVSRGGTDDEIHMAGLWLNISTDLIDNNYDQWDQHLEWVAKKQLVESAFETGRIKHPESALAIDIKWHEPFGKMQQNARGKNLIAMMPLEKEIEAASGEAPDPTRARIRGSYISEQVEARNKKIDVSWKHIGRGETLIPLNDAYQSEL